jgi:hypothetical protein
MANQPKKVVAVNAGRAMPDKLTEFHRLNAIEKAATKAALDRCRALADQIESELLKKGAEDFQDLTVFADFKLHLRVPPRPSNGLMPCVRRLKRFH